MKPVNNAELKDVLRSLNTYSSERRKFLESIDWLDSNRDPFSVASEILVQHLMGGQLADSQVQAGWDLIDESRKRVQIKYLANTREKWANGHDVKFPEGVDHFALVVFEQHAPQAVLVFNKFHIGSLCERLNKRHGNQDSEIQLTQSNYQVILKNAADMEQEDLVSVFRIN